MMLTQGFYYFLAIAELAILGLIIAGIWLKIKRAMAMFAEAADDKNFEHDVSQSDHSVAAAEGNLIDCPTEMSNSNDGAREVPPP